MRVLLLSLWAMAAVVQASEIYRWVDDKGKVHYGDRPAPQSKQSSRVISKPNVVEVDKESYQLRRAREKMPVILFITTCGPVCDRAKDHLNQRGVPFGIKDPTKAPEIAVELKKLAGAIEVPVLQVGTDFRKGFDAVAWDGLLTSAGYPLKTGPVPENP